jgi:hypothetical protein
MALLFPGHNYLGPGNDAFRPEEPVDEDDRIAQRHDIAYATATEPQHIRQADQTAIREFTYDAFFNRN